MDNKHENGQNDPLKEYYREIADTMNPPPALVNKVKGGVTMKLFPKSVHVKRFAQAVMCYAIGVALLLSVVILLPKLWEREEPIATQPVEPAVTAPQVEVPFSSLYEGETVTAVEYLNLHFAPTVFKTTDSEMIDALHRELEQINATTSSHFSKFPRDLGMVLHFEHGGYAVYNFKQGGNAVNCTVYDASKSQQSFKKFKISDADRARVEEFISAQVEVLVPLTNVPDPNEYLDGKITEATLRYRYEDSGDNRMLDDAPIADIIKGFTTILKGLPLDTRPWAMDEKYYDVELIFKNEEQVNITLYPNTGLIMVELNLEGSAQDNAYCFRIPEVNARECAFWLDKYYRGEDVSEFPTLEYYLNQRTCIFFGFYDSVDSERWAYVSENNTVEEQFYQFIQNLNFVLVSEDIPAQESRPDGKKIVITTSSNSEELVFELDSSGKVNCQLLDAYWRYPLFAAQYVLSEEDYASLTAYMEQLLNADT